GPVTRLAVHPDLAAGDLADPTGKVVQRYLQRPADVRRVPFPAAADVEHYPRPVRKGPRQRGEVADRVSPHRISARPALRRAGRGRLDSVDADADQVALRLGDLL